MTVLELLEMASEDMEIIVKTENGETLYEGTADDVVRCYFYLGETELSSSYFIYKDKMYIPIDPDEEELEDIKEEIDDGEDYSDFDEA